MKIVFYAKVHIKLKWISSKINCFMELNQHLLSIQFIINISMKLFIAFSVALIFIISHCQVEIIEDDASKIIPNLGQCKWNKKSKICEDPTKKCTGKFCCKTTGKLLNGIPQCKCSNTLLEGSCDPCVYTGIGTECRDSTSGKCTGKSCCQASFFPGTK